MPKITTFAPPSQKLLGMMKKISLMSILLCLSVVALAQGKTINITAGTLDEAVGGNYDFTTLTVSGTMDVRDFAALNDNATSLTAIDLSGCAIVGYDSRDEQYLGYCTHFEANVLPSSAFFGFVELQEVILPASVTEIGNGAFAGCEQLRAVTLGSNLTKIGDYAFSGCVALQEVEFPLTMQRIGDYAFDKCAALEQVNLEQCNHLSYIGKRAFAQNVALAIVALPTAVGEMGNAAFAGCEKLTQVTFPQRIKTCGEGLFASAQALQVIDLSQSNLAGLPAWTFAGCESLKDVSLPETITSIEEGAFYYCSSLAGIILPVGIDTLHPFAFAGCSGMQEITFMPEGLESIGRYTFYDNESAARVNIPATVAYIGDHGFDGCVNAAIFETPREMPAELGEMVFANMNVEEKELCVLTESIILYESAAQWQDFGKIGGASAVEDVVDNNTLRTMFESYTLRIVSGEEMSDVRLYDTSGMLLAHLTPHATEATINTQSFVSNIYVLVVTTADNNRVVAKLARVIR